MILENHSCPEKQSGGMCNLEKLHFSWSKVPSFRYLGKLLMFGNCVLQRKKKDFYVQDKGNEIMFCTSVLEEGGKNENIQLVFTGRGPVARGKEIILDPGETWRSWNLNLALTEFSKEKLSCFHKYLGVFRDEKLLFSLPAFLHEEVFEKLFILKISRESLPEEVQHILDMCMCTTCMLI